MSHEVFISYASPDKVVADAVCARLEAQELRCWIAPRDVLAGTEYGEAILAAIEDCRVMILVFSAHANKSQHIRREVERAVSKGKIILPFRIEDVMPSGALEYCISSTHWLDALTPPLESHIANLGTTLKRLLSLPTVAEKATSQHPTAGPALDVTPTPRVLARLAGLVRTGTPEEVEQLVRGLKLTISPNAKRAASRFIGWLERYNHPGYATIGDALYAWLTADKGADQVAEDWTLFLRMVGCVLISTELKDGVRVGRVDNDLTELLGLPDSDEWVQFIDRDLFGEAVNENRMRKQSR